MSTTPPPNRPNLIPPGDREIRIISHSSLFYWWPVWALGFILTIITWYDGTRALHVPSGTKVEQHDGDLKLVVPEKSRNAMTADLQKFEQRQPRVSHRAWMGPSFCIVLLLVIVITNVPLRGLWSLVVIVTVVLVSIILGLAGWWDDILASFRNLHVYIGMAGYLLISTVLFVAWCVTTFVFDQQIYIIFSPGQMKVREEVGGGEKSYDTIGMTIEKHRDDLFRHWVLGLGSGDLTVRTTGAQIHTVVLPNVLFIGRKLAAIENMQREKTIVTG
jgi:hypothetical protein